MTDQELRRWRGLSRMTRRSRVRSARSGIGD